MKSDVRYFNGLNKYFFSKNTSLWLFIILTIIGIARGLQHFYIVDEFEPLQFSLWWHIPFNLFLWWSWFLFIPIIYWIVLKINAETYKIVYWLIIGFIVPIAVVLIRQIMASFIIAHVLVGYATFDVLIFRRMLSNVWMWLDIITYFAILLGIRMVEFQKRGKANELRLMQLQTQLEQSKLNALESQLHPHFLFNTLNTLSTLILKTDDDEALRMLNLLENFLRTTIYENQKDEIAFKDELRFINHYLEIEKVRFKDKLEVIEEIAKETSNARIPNFLLQPIVENSIHHAIAAKTTKGLIKITSKIENGFLLIFVEDNGSGIESFNKTRLNTGVGIKNTKERLLYLYGKAQTFKLENSELGGLKVVFKIPFKEFGSNVSITQFKEQAILA
jgi:sensor histidine kinase YesM